MKNILLAFATLCTNVLIAQDKDTPYLTKSLKNEKINTVDLQTSGGSLQIIAVNDSEARLEVFVRPGNDRKLTKQEIDRLLEESHDLTITTSNGQLKAISLTKKRGKNNNLSVSFKAYVPKSTSAHLNTSGGSLSISGLSGSVDGSTSGGSIKINDVTNNINLKTSGGSIDAKNASGNIKLATSGGSIKLQDLKGTIYAQTSGGSIKGDHIKGELIAKTSGGSISIDRMSGSVELATSAGNTHLQLLEIDQFVKVNVSAGNVDIELPLNKGLDVDLSANHIQIPSNQFTGIKEKNKMIGKINGGGTPVKVSASAGNIKLSSL